LTKGPVRKVQGGKDQEALGIGAKREAQQQRKREGGEKREKKREGRGKKKILAGKKTQRGRNRKSVNTRIPRQQEKN